MPGLTKPTEYDWRDSNVALLGTDKDRAIKSKIGRLITIELFHFLDVKMCYLLPISFRLFDRLKLFDAFLHESRFTHTNQKRIDRVEIP